MQLITVFNAKFKVIERSASSSLLVGALTCVFIMLSIVLKSENIMKYNNTIRPWKCGSNIVESHISGISTAYFFPLTSLDAINNCCYEHDANYCCQIGRKAADDKLYICLETHCKGPYCDNVIRMYRYLLDSLGNSAYVGSIEDFENCQHFNCSDYSK